MRFARIFHNPVPKVLPACLMHSKTHRYLPLKNIIVINYRCFVYFSFSFLWLSLSVSLMHLLSIPKMILVMID